ncbi:MAG: secretin N-terminal domain-containing protein [Pseudomonadota bacterium]|nr:secretin N-terminal domain-containing protein [Pseudomonadota bacterium]
MVRKMGGRERKASGLRAVSATFLLGCVFAFSGCQDRPTADAINHNAQEARQSLDSFMTAVPPKHYNPLVVTDKVWAGNTALRMQRGLPLPTRFETTRGITLVSSDPMTLNDIANAITMQTGVSVRVSQLGAGPASVQQAAPSMPLAYEGPLSGLLERVAGYFGVNWRYNGATIELSRFETRVFVVEALPGTQKIEEGMQDETSSGGGGGAAGGASQQNTITQNSKTNIDMKYWDELGQSLTSMVAGNGTVVVSPSLGTVTVTTTSDNMRSIAQYLSQENQRLSRQIAINVEIYVVTLEEGLDFNVAFNTALKRLTDFAGNIAGAGAPGAVSGFTGGGSLSVAILNPKGSGQITDVFKALSGVGNTTKVAKFPLVTLNNRPVSRRVGEQISYVASSQTTVAGTSGTPTTSLTPATIPEGFSVQLTPRLLDDGRILLEYSLSDIDLLSIKVFNSQCGDITSGSGSCSTAGSTTIQSPDTVQRIFVQQSVLKSGSMLIIGGVEEQNLAQNKQGVGSPDNFLLGGGISSNRTHTMIFFAVTPQVLDVAHSEQE